MWRSDYLTPRTLRHVKDGTSKTFLAGEALGEVLIADNGSTDGSLELAQRCGARVQISRVGNESP